MFVRTKTTPNSPRKSIQIVENTRDSKTNKVKQKILRYIGVALDDAEEAKLKQLAMEIMVKMQVAQEAQQVATSGQSSMIMPLSSTELLLELAPENKLGRRAKKRIEDVTPASGVTLDMIKEEARIIDGIHEVAGYVYETLGYANILSNEKYNKILKDLVLCRISNPSSKLATSSLLSRYGFVA